MPPKYILSVTSIAAAARIVKARPQKTVGISCRARYNDGARLGYWRRAMDKTGRAPGSPMEPELQEFHTGAAVHAYRTFGCHALPGAAGHRFAVWAPHAQRVALVGDFNGWDTAATPMHRLPDGTWVQTVAGLRDGALYKYAVTGPDGQTVLKADPFRRALRDRARDRIQGLGNRGLRLARPELSAPPRRARRVPRADEHLRGAPRLLAPAGGRSAVVPLGRRRAGGLLPRDALHTRGAAARDGIPLRGLLGLSGDRVLRPHQPLWYAAGLHVLC